MQGGPEKDAVPLNQHSPVIGQKAAPEDVQGISARLKRGEVCFSIVILLNRQRWTELRLV